MRALNAKHHTGNYGRSPLVIVRGEGMYLWDADGNRYLDFVAGISVANLGHCPPRPTAAAKRQLETLWHASNLYHTVPQARLAEWLTQHSFADRVFFSNSGAEANEAALKLARKRSNDVHGPGRFEVITATNSFHGRTFATLTATGQEKVHAGFEPLVPGFTYVPFGDLEAVALAITPRTCAILIEPIQGEGGVNVPPTGYLRGLRQLADDAGLTLIFDEVQSGLGRAGALWAYERFDVTPDVMTLAKSLGSGLPIGAMLATEGVAQHLTKGSHGSTFGGNPVACAAALATCETLVEEKLPERARTLETTLGEGLRALAAEHDAIREVRGMGLIWGMDLTVDAAPVVDACRERGVLVNAVQGRTLRFLPPLIVSEAEITSMLATLDAAFTALGL
ncbi:MAG: aspartate aminotransferase family protein [Deltaproteobacteria bacterium]|nr:aspartate aminotransferase family protein [Deltaproteobacteria bacterium]